MSAFKHITSADNPQFKQLKKLATSARARRKAGQTLLDGVHLLHALADAGGSPELLVVREGAQEAAENGACLARFPQVAQLLLTPALFDAIAPVETPTGVLALLNIVAPSHGDHRCAVLLENIQDPGNLGSIIRTAAAAGCDAVFLSRGCAEAWSPKALRAGMGAHFSVAIFEQQDMVEVVRNFSLVLATRLDATHSLYDIDLRGTVAFLFGNEGAGLSPELSACATRQVKIPMPGKVESLNVAAAVAVCLFERVRQLTRD
ncbi:TrmH family RNA methyltransferase [Sulfurivermis fontis]|jgi:TrmH family RNA methyltransferase|uniref:TrmH family RNA methyltransferase n=1 Tax=Sulfurivermis fontis TaxID=1972068 RepID=UPI000FDB9A6B|nr:RNA methyltransferase [Sulfurivermis fontis]